MAVFSNPMTTTEVCKLLFGRNTITQGDDYDKDHKQIINQYKFQKFIQSNVKQDTIIKLRKLPVIKNNYIMVFIVSCGVDIWISATNLI